MADLVRTERQDLDGIRTDVNRLLADSLLRTWPGTRYEGTFPTLDVISKGENLVVLVDLPGVAKDDVDMVVTNESLSISGRTASAENGKALWKERFEGGFSRSIRLFVPVKADEVTASFDNGVLRISLPKADEARPRAVKIA
ncbi:MAG: Hsp20/alpha crystallin family protein [Bacillota bacterium]